MKAEVQLPQTAVDTIESTYQRARLLANRVSDLRGRLLGHPPRPTEACSAPAPHDALLPRLGNQAASLNAVMIEALDDLDAIDRAL